LADDGLMDLPNGKGFLHDVSRKLQQRMVPAKSVSMERNVYQDKRDQCQDSHQAVGHEFF
jgi:hypothetical protein